MNNKFDRLSTDIIDNDDVKQINIIYLIIMFQILDQVLLIQLDFMI